VLLPSRHRLQFEIFNDWANKVNYFVTAQACHEAPARGSIQDRIP
jgi:hypothetical protein